MFEKNDEIQPYWYLVGIVSQGNHRCGSEGWAGIYTRVAPYLQWIETKIRP
jgi:secreted trypsin-like serine protease